MSEGTLVFCPQCDGVRKIPKLEYFIDQFGSYPMTHELEDCELCHGSGWVTPSTSQAYTKRIRDYQRRMNQILIFGSAAVLLILIVVALLLNGVNPLDWLRTF